MTTPSSPSIKVAVAVLALALVLGVLVHAHPEKLRAPAWVAYAASGALGVAGLCIGALALGLARTARWLACLLLATMTAIPAWIAFGPGARQCTVMTLGMRTGESALVCRGAFAVAAMVLGVMFLGALRSAVRAGRAAG